MTAYRAPVGAPIWIDLTSGAPDASVEFYGTVFGWEADPADDAHGGYRNFRLNGEPVAGLMAEQEGAPSDVWSTYLHVGDAAAALADAARAGAHTVVPVTEVGELGKFGFVVDPAGAAIGVWQPGTHRGFVERGDPGSPYWFDCHSRDFEASTMFYRDVFGWAYEQAGTGGQVDAVGPDRYAIAAVDIAGGNRETDKRETVAGIMDSASMFDSGAFGQGTPSFWQVYFTVDDADAAAKQITSAGGTIVREAETTPWGTLGVAADTTGAVFLFATPPPGAQR